MTDHGRACARRAAIRAVARVAAGLCLLARASAADDRVASAVAYYADSDATDIRSGATRASADPWSGGTVEARYLIDVITSASVDVISQATRRRAFTDVHQTVAGSVRQAWDPLAARLAYAHTWETDYRGDRVGAGVDLSRPARATTLALDWSYDRATLWRVNQPALTHERGAHEVALGLTQALSPNLVLEAGTSAEWLDGFLANPYRHARVGAEIGGSCVACPWERVPDRRVRLAAFASLRLGLSRRAAVEARYRAYADTWAVASHTGEALVEIAPRSGLGVELRARGYRQGAAYFYRDGYSEMRRYMTADKELSPLASWLAGARLWGATRALGPIRRVEAHARLDAFQFDYDAFARLPRRRGILAEAGLEVLLP